MKKSEKILPQVCDIEQVLIGEMIQFPDHINEVVSILQPDDLYKPANQVLFREIYNLWNQGKKIDLPILTNYLSDQNILDEIGGSFYITKIMEGALHPAYIKDHAYIVKDASIKRKFIFFAGKLAKYAYESDIDDLIKYSNEGLDQITENIFRSGESTSFKDLLNEMIERYFLRKEKAEKGLITGINTPIFDLNKTTGGWQPGDLIIIAGRPSMGKTALAINCAATAARLDFAVDFYSLEMTCQQLTERLICCVENIDIDSLRSGKLSGEDEDLMEKTANKIHKQILTIDDKPGITAEYIKAKSSANRRKGKCDLIIVDYLQLMSFDQKLNTVEGLGSITRKLKGLAKDLKVPILLLSQLSREVEKRSNKRPQLADLRSSGEIEQDADMVIFPFREFYYTGDQDDKGIMEIIIAKNRNGKTGIVEARHNETLTKIFDCYEKEPIPESIPF